MRIALTILIFAAGLAASITLTKAHAATVTLADLPGLGYVLALRFDVQTGCGMYWVTGGNGAQETLIGDPSHPGCQEPGAIEAHIANLLALYPPASTTTSAAPVTVTVTTTQTSTELVTTTAPAVTETVATTVTVPSTVTQTVNQVATVERTLTETVTAPVTTTATVPQAVTVDDAASQAYVAALAAGWDEPYAALAARSAGLNVEYALT